MRSKLFATAGACLTVFAFTLPGLADAGPAAAAVASARPSSATPATPAAPAILGGASSAKAAAAPSLLPRTQSSEGTDACRKSADLLVMQCQSHSIPSSKFTSKKSAKNSAAPAASGLESLTPADLQSAYGMAGPSGSSGGGQTVAVVDAFHDANADADLTHYRSEYGLPACTQASGCLSVYNQDGTNLLSDPSAAPPASPTNDDWMFEESLDLDMVSAICPNCKIALIEADSDMLTDLGTAENTAVALGAKFVSNSWSGGDYPGEAALDSYFDHPGVAIAFASGDFGYGAAYPASSQFVTSVGGTYLDQNSAGAWTTTTWNDAFGATGAGCSSGEPQTAWSWNPGSLTTSNQCGNRVENDVSAVADAPNGIAVYDSNDPGVQCYGDCGAYGTSAATPIITSMYALAGTPKANTYPVDYLYQHKSDLTPVTTGTDSFAGGIQCETARRYLCSANAHTSAGFDGPGGLGTPAGGDLNAFTTTQTSYISVKSPGTQDFQAGQTVSIPVKAISQSGASLAYAASGLPPGLTIDAGTGVISGKLSTTPVQTTVKVSATDGTNTTSVSFRFTTVKSMTSGFHASPGQITLFGGKCLDDSNGLTTNGNKIDIAPCSTAAKMQWTYVPSPIPGGAGLLEIYGKCATITGSNVTAAGDKVQLSSCVNAGYQKWLMTGSYGELYNPASGLCLEAPSTTAASGVATVIAQCDGKNWQGWKLGPSPINSGVPGMCWTIGSNANGSAVYIEACSGSAGQKYSFSLDNLQGTNHIGTNGGKCVSAKSGGTIDGTGLVIEPCNLNDYNQRWFIGANGTLENVNSEKCAEDPGNSTVAGKQLILDDCYGAQGDLWATS